jgi:hypothetical protein
MTLSYTRGALEKYVSPVDRSNPKVSPASASDKRNVLLKSVCHERYNSWCEPIQINFQPKL